ncbi:MAG: conjugal transfer protein TraX [Candidatus Pristimantibacillus lignocellulolyticus]|uniref:Conjugal transfer protein TraX n=1 Tax=Candidatus Pristimantibacillus lignocellulolyticus TaxID=2994561 RepID=A0A9J6ZGD1_9BACL|nr:MAG: conjugal transfer protein TraX [Candidatus Pristimantibacillus lignocellulolyticus]
MQWIAMLTMLIDHIGAVFFPNELMLRIIGRLSFPIYTYLMVVGYHRTSNFSKYVLRLGLLAIISQLPYTLTFDVLRFNVIATLLVCLLTLKILDMKKIHLAIRVFLAVGSLVLLEIVSFDYGAYALVLMLIYRYFTSSVMFIVQFIAEIIFMVYHSWLIQFISMIVTYTIAFHPNIIQKLSHWRAPNWIWRSFYPLHLTIIAMINLYITLLD